MGCMTAAEKPVIEVHMLGEFSITINGNTITNLKGRTKRVWMLIEYLIAHRHMEVSLEKLMEILWEEDECGDPMNSLKNLIYRARTLLRDLYGSEEAEFIRFSRGIYFWNNEYPCTVDTEELEKAWKTACRRELSSEEQIAGYKRVIELYRGEFLPKSAYRSWVVSMGVRYTTLFTESVLRVSDLLTERNRHQEVIEICEKALNFVPLEESIHKTLLYAYASAGQRSKALEHYNYATNLFYREMGVDLSGTLQALYQQLVQNVNSVEMDLNVIKEDLREAAETQGAFWCDYNVFKNIYRIQARSISRTHQSIFVVLLTITDREGGLLEGEVAKVAVERFKNAILSSLRLGDAVSLYSNSQFIVMLPTITYENVEMVVNRILQKFRFDYRRNNVRISSRISPLEVKGALPYKPPAEPGPNQTK